MGVGTRVDEQPGDLSDPGKGASPAKFPDSAVNFSTCLSASEALTVSIPWESGVQGHICRFRACARQEERGEKRRLLLADVDTLFSVCLCEKHICRLNSHVHNS